MLELRSISKSYGINKILNDINLTIENNKFVAFLGPSGCGKTTLLRIIAGLIDDFSGEILLEGKDIGHMPPSKRNVAMVFQNYALYPQLSVYDNMAFGLRNLKLDERDISERIRNAMAILEIDHLQGKKPAELSGGQRQRVAIGRAIVKQPHIFLLDEPLSNLDAALRLKTRIELAQIHKKVRGIMIMVTHDQIEAMTLADIIVVLKDEIIQQSGSPLEVYSRPNNKFVASFIGSVPINFINFRPKNINGRINADISEKSPLETAYEWYDAAEGKDFCLGIRPENLMICAKADADLIARVDFIERLGDRSIVYLSLAGGQKLSVEMRGDIEIADNHEVGIAIDRQKLLIFDENGVSLHLRGQNNAQK